MIFLSEKLEIIALGLLYKYEVKRKELKNV